MLATHRHESILGGSRVESMLSHAAEQRAAELDTNIHAQSNAARTARDIGSSSSVVVQPASGAPTSVVSILAAWQGITIAQMAQKLLDMTVEQRTLLRQQYAGQTGSANQ